MKKKNWILICIAVLLGSPLLAKPYFVIDMFLENPLVANEGERYVEALKKLVKQEGGELHVRPIKVVQQIETDVKPASTTAFGYDWVGILHFPNKKTANKFALGEDYAQLIVQHSKAFRTHTSFLSKRMSALPGMPNFPLIQNDLLHPDPAFLLVNAIDMKKTPGAVMRMMRYFKSNYPLLTDYGTQFFATFKVSEVVQGAFGFDMIFLTEWESMEKFHEVHEHPKFRENVHLRNNSFKGFTEAEGRAL